MMGRAPRQETGPPLASDERFLAQTYYTIGACGRMARRPITLDSHMIGEFQRVSAVWGKGRNKNNAEY